MNTRKPFRTLRIISQLLLMCLVTVPTLSSATIINILSEQLVVSLKTLDESYTYVGSGFTAPGWNAVHKQTLLPNYNPYEPAPSYFSSMYWWDAYQYDSGFKFTGDANTDRYIGSGDYDPHANVYASSIVSFNMLFAVEGDGASLIPDTYGGISNSSITIMDLTSGTLFSEGELLSGHEYQVNAWSRSVNGSGNEQLFWLNFLDAQASAPKPSRTIARVPGPFATIASVPEPSAIVLVIAGLTGLAFAGRKRRPMELLEAIS